MKCVEGSLSAISILLKFSYQSLAQMRFEEFKMGSGIKDSLDSTGKKITIYPELPKLSDSESAEMKKFLKK